MKRAATLSAVAACAAALTIARAQGTRPAPPSDRLARTAKELGTTPERLRELVDKDLGDPVAVDDDLVVGVSRGADGHVRTVRVNTPKRSLEFNVRADDGRPGLQYIGGEASPDAPFASATDIDGDARVDQIIIQRPVREGLKVAILLRVGDRFEPARGVGEHRFKLEVDGRVMRFDRAGHEWAEDK
jgi:hypothetical protein